MKRRPRNAENRIAEELNKHLIPLGYTPLQRVPVLGRRGPDLTINEFNLVIDVKTRLEVPKSYMVDGVTLFGSLTGVPVADLPLLLTQGPFPRVAPRKTVDDYYAHMDEWTRHFGPLE